tara:strand:+ start:137 stop:586 length:450 start_codon:yes stop_codon:yes gene_type:complete
MQQSSIGARLIAAREHSRFTLENISENTNMPLKKLEAFENDEINIENLNAFDKAYLKKYCQFIGVIYDDLFSDIKLKAIKLDPIQDKQVQTFKSSSYRRNRKLNIKYIVIIAATSACAFLLYNAFSQSDVDALENNNQIMLNNVLNQNI